MLNPGQAGYDGPRAEQLYRTIRDRVGALPGIASVSFASNLPLFAGPSRKLSAAGPATFGDGDGALTVVNIVGHDYFATTEVMIERGRQFVDSDRGASAPVAIINEALARQSWRGRDPLGDQIRFVGDQEPRQIIGVAETVNYDEIGEAPQGCVYLPLAQNLTDAIVLYVRTTSDPGPAMMTVRRELARIDDRLDVADARPVSKVIDQALYGARMSGALLGVFGSLALALAALGMYGVMAYAVQLRQREMGVRMALGAAPTRVVRLVLRDGIRLVVAGLAIGVVGAAGIGTLLSGLLHGVNPVDPVSVSAATLVLAIVGFVACYLPARRASAVGPAQRPSRRLSAITRARPLKRVAHLRDGRRGGILHFQNGPQAIDRRTLLARGGAALRGGARHRVLQERTRGFSADGLEQLRPGLERHIEPGFAPGMVGLVARGPDVETFVLGKMAFGDGR